MSKKVLLVASHGGHWVQIRKISPAFSGMNIHYMTTTHGVQSELQDETLHVVPDAHLDEKFKLIVLALRILIVIIKVRPKIIMSTGAAPGFFAILIGKIFGAKTIWVDSVANIDKLSVSGSKVGRFADLWLTQWQHLEKPGGPYYKGSVL